MSRLDIHPGSRVYARTHKAGEIHVDVVGRGVLLGRLVNRDRRPGLREVVVDLDAVTHIRMSLMEELPWPQRHSPQRFRCVDLNGKTINEIAEMCGLTEELT